MKPPATDWFLNTFDTDSARAWSRQHIICTALACMALDALDAGI